ncbi:MAG: TetR/AcrR family transcriptional regulator [Bacteroidia bacterium]|nr:TetR/AcrR family transcriptional regulator [Bacteroidia bacterium]
MLSKSDRTKLFIIERVAPLFNTKGYAATSMSDILRATGLAKGGIYGNFKNKDEIALEAFDYSFNKLREALRFKIKQESTAFAKLNAILDFYHNYSESPVIEGGCVLLNTATDADDAIPFLKDRARQGLKEMLASLKHIIEKGIEAGEFSKKLNPLDEAELIFATIEGGIMMSKLNDSPVILNKLLENLKLQIKQRFLK